jgi:hypothetical protein
VGVGYSAVARTTDGGATFWRLRWQDASLGAPLGLSYLASALQHTHELLGRTSSRETPRHTQTLRQIQRRTHSIEWISEQYRLRGGSDHGFLPRHT